MPDQASEGCLVQVLARVFLPCLAAQQAGGPASGAEQATGAPRGPAELHRHAQKFASLLAHTREQVEGELRE